MSCLAKRMLMHSTPDGLTLPEAAARREKMTCFTRVCCDRLCCCHHRSRPDLAADKYFRKHPEPFFTLASEMLPGNHDPTPAHFFLRLLADKGLLRRIYTQNIVSDCCISRLTPSATIAAVADTPYWKACDWLHCD